MKLSVTNFVSIGLALLPSIADANNVFAHVVVGDTAAHNQSTWLDDIKLAAEAGIDAFVLNMGYPDPNIPTQVANAFAAAESYNDGAFKMLFAFDYLGGGQPWPPTGDNSVVSYLQKYGPSKAYFNYEGGPFVSTFEGVNNVADWAPSGPIRSAVDNVYFVPDWTSLGPDGVKQHIDNIQGCFSWDMWPQGAVDINTTHDQEWVDAMGEKSYMMGVSPWFFHSASGGTNWVWRADDMWHERWNQAKELNPKFAQIVTWNDWGESSYIGPIRDQSEIPAGSAQFDNGFPHDAFRAFLPYYIAQYKGESYTIDKDQMQYWYRTAPTSGGSACNVRGNADWQPVVDPNTIVQDEVFFSALLTEDATITVQIGSNGATSYDGKKGINHWNQPFNGQTGEVKFSIVRNGETVASGTGESIDAKAQLPTGCNNYNAWAGSFSS